MAEDGPGVSLSWGIRVGGVVWRFDLVLGCSGVGVLLLLLWLKEEVEEGERELGRDYVFLRFALLSYGR